VATRESIITRAKDINYSFERVNYYIEKYHENYSRRPFKIEELNKKSTLVNNIKSFLKEEFDETPVLVLNEIGRHYWFFDEYRRAVDPVALFNGMRDLFETTIEVRERNLGAAGLYKIMYFIVKLQREVVEKPKKVASHFDKRALLQREDHLKNSYYPEQTILKIYDRDLFQGLKNKNILFVTSSNDPCLELCQLCNPKKIIILKSFSEVLTVD
jgi:hypothetical protein